MSLRDKPKPCNSSKATFVSFTNSFKQPLASVLSRQLNGKYRYFTTLITFVWKGNVHRVIVTVDRGRDDALSNWSQYSCKESFSFGLYKTLYTVVSDRTMTCVVDRSCSVYGLLSNKNKSGSDNRIMYSQQSDNLHLKGTSRTTFSLFVQCYPWHPGTE